MGPRRIDARVLTGPRTVVALLVAMLAFAALGAWLPADRGHAVFGTWAFRAVAAALCASVILNLWERLAGVTQAGILGSWLLHLGIVMLLAAGAWHAARFAETPVSLVEGQTAVLGDTGASIRLDRLRPEWGNGRWPGGPAAEVTLFRPGAEPRREVVRVNRPLSVGDHWLRLGLHGFAPAVAIGDASGIVKLETTLDPRPYYWGRFGVPGDAVRLLGVFRPASSGHLVRDPSLKVVASGPGGRTLGSGTARPGSPARVAGLTISLGEVRYWAAFTLAREPGLRVVFAGFWIAIAGAALTLLPRVFRGGL